MGGTARALLVALTYCWTSPPRLQRRMGHSPAPRRTERNPGWSRRGRYRRRRRHRCVGLAPQRRWRRTPSPPAQIGMWCAWLLPPACSLRTLRFARLPCALRVLQLPVACRSLLCACWQVTARVQPLRFATSATKCRGARADRSTCSSIRSTIIGRVFGGRWIEGNQTLRASPRYHGRVETRFTTSSSTR